MTKTILAIDDDADTRTLLAALLEAEGYRALTADGGKAALALLETETPDLILLDLSMPEMDGFDFCRELSHGGRSRSIPIIVLTALDTFTYSEEFLSSLFDVQLFMYKPFKPNVLLENVRTALARPPAHIPEERT
ncbi:MAG: response regulator [Planctomycetes bacterium]|nr:response regulator [Planctomycetota bacterium]